MRSLLIQINYLKFNNRAHHLLIILFDAVWHPVNFEESWSLKFFNKKNYVKNYPS